MPSARRRGDGETAPGHPLPDWPDVYVAELSICGMMGASAVVAGVTISGVRKRRMTDPAFADREAAARAAFREIAIDEVVRRAIHGTDEVTISANGREVHRTIYSDPLALRVLEWQETGSFRQKQQVEHSGGIASLPTLAARKQRLIEARAAAEADHVASLGAGGQALLGAAYVRAEG